MHTVSVLREQVIIYVPHAHAHSHCVLSFAIARAGPFHDVSEEPYTDTLQGPFVELLGRVSPAGCYFIS